MRDITRRTRYRRSGAVAWHRFLLAAPAALAVAAVMGWLLFLLFDAGWYFMIAVPAVLALPVLLAVYLAVATGHCRNVWVAGVLAFAATCVFCLGYSHARLLNVEGLQVLPQNPMGNWIIFGVEFLVAWALIAVGAVYRASRAYCEDCGLWMRKLTAVVPPGDGMMIADALREDDLESLPAVPVYEVKMGIPCGMIDAEYCPSRPERGSLCRVFLTIKEQKKRQFAEQPMFTVMDQALLWPEEVELVAARVAGLRPLVLTPPRDEPEGAASARAARPGTHAAAITRLPPEAAGRMFSGWTTAAAVALSFVPVISFLAGVGLLVAGGFLVRPAADNRLLGGLLLAAGLAATVFGAVVCWTNVDYYNFRHMQRLVRRIIAGRPDATVMTQEPDAVDVDVVPRANWSGIHADSAADRGLLVIDGRRRELRFEGMKERVRIPAAALLSCEVEPLVPMAGRWTIYGVVVKARYPADAPPSVSGGHHEDEWEVPFLPRPTQFRKYNRVYRLKACEELRRRVRALMKPARGVVHDDRS